MLVISSKYCRYFRRSSSVDLSFVAVKPLNPRAEQLYHNIKKKESKEKKKSQSLQKESSRKKFRSIILLLRLVYLITNPESFSKYKLLGLQQIYIYIFIYEIVLIVNAYKTYNYNIFNAYRQKQILPIQQWSLLRLENQNS